MKTNLTTILLASTLLISVVSCKEDKNAKLIKLKKEQQELVTKINELQAEIASQNTDSTKNEGVNIVTETVANKPFHHAIEVQGTLDSDENLKVFPQTQGVVTQVLVKVGDRVSKGQVIAKIDDQAMRKSYAQMNAQYKLAADMYERQKGLWEQKIGSEVQFLQAKSQKEALENGLASLKDQLNYAQIKSPINGSIEELPIRVGMSASPASPVATVINFSSMKIVAEIAEAYNTSVSIGDPVTLYFPDLGKEVGSKIATASKFINPQNRSFKVEVKVPGNINNLKANMIAVVRITDYKNNNAIVVNLNAIQSDASGAYVYVAANTKGKLIAHKKYVTQGMTYNGATEIKNGLSAGDKVITVGQLGLTEGAPVRL